MSAERYKIQRLDQGTEMITPNSSSNVEPFPLKRWNEPLPIAAEGKPLQNPGEEKTEAKSLTRFYPPLLFFSTSLTAVFLYLYMSKPVIVTGEGASAPKIQKPQRLPRFRKRSRRRLRKMSFLLGPKLRLLLRMSCPD